MQARVIQEVTMLLAKFSDLEHGKDFDWVLLPSVLLPVGRFNKDRCKILFGIPVGYPQTGPDNFFVDVDLRLNGGGTPPAFSVGNQSSSGAAALQGTWGWFSWHPKNWRPAATVEGG